MHKTWQKSVCASGLSNRQSRNKRKGIRKSLPYPRQLSKIRYLGIATTQKQRLQRRDTPTPPPIPHKRNLTIQPKKPDHKSLSNNILPKKHHQREGSFDGVFCEKCLIISQMIVEGKQDPHLLKCSYFSLCSLSRNQP